MTEDSIRVTAGRPATRSGPRGSGRLPAPAPPTELLVLACLSIALLIAAAVADNFTAPFVWGFVTALGVAYILSRGLARRARHDDVR
jgi:hypothetical protein